MTNKIVSALIIVSLLVACTPTATPFSPIAIITEITATQTSVPPTATPDSYVEITFEAPRQENGITLLELGGDNRYTTVTVDGNAAVATDGFASHIRTNYIYFRVPNGFYKKQQPLTIELEYYDEGEGSVFLQYNSSSTESWEPDYKTINMAYRLNTRQWKTAAYVIQDAAFAHRQSLGADFRVTAEVSPLIIRSIRITRGGALPPTPAPQPTVAVPAAFPSPLPERAVFTYYFYWYDGPNGAFNLTNTPVDYQTMSWRNPGWHLKQLQEISAAGIDVILPIYWYREDDLSWSQAGLVKLVEAMEQMRLLGQTPPAAGLFMDTTSSQGRDLRLESEQANLYEKIHFFFVTLPRGYWALAEQERPIIWFYTSIWPAAYDQGFIDYIYEHFQKDFGVRPYLVFEGSWDYPTETKNGQPVKNYNAPHLKYDASYGWGGAVSPLFSPQVASIGPGYDDHAVEDRIPPTYSDRKNGETYQRAFDVAIRCGSPWLAIETWNEFMEATEISETLQYSRQYLDLTQALVPYFKLGTLPENTQLGNFTTATEIDFQVGQLRQDAGLNPGLSLGDGLYEVVELAGTAALQTIPMTPEAQAAYLYFAVDNSFYFNQTQKISLTVTYWDNGYDPIYLNYDTAQCASPFNVDKMYKQRVLVYRNNSETWKTVTLQIQDATFANNQNFGSDFRFATETTPLAISAVQITKVP